jgi:predicted type IV restriction endonuclease
MVYLWDFQKITQMTLTGYWILNSGSWEKNLVSFSKQEAKKMEGTELQSSEQNEIILQKSAKRQIKKGSKEPE